MAAESKPASGPGVAGERRLSRPDEIRRLRKLRGWTQGDIAAAAGIGASTVESLERGHFASPRVQEALSDALAVGLDALFEPGQPGVSFEDALAIAECSRPTLTKAVKNGDVTPLAGTLPEEERAQRPDELPETMSVRELAAATGLSRAKVSLDLRNQMIVGTRRHTGEWQASRTESVRYLARRRRVVAHRFDPEDLLQWKRVREQRSAERTVRAVCANGQCGKEVARAQSRLDAGQRRIYCGQACYREHKDELLREKIMQKAGGCGSPACADPDCQVEPGSCHLPSCAELARLAPKSSRQNRWVKGLPTAFCSPGHASVARNSGAGDAARLRQLQDAGYTNDIAQLAKKIRRAEPVARRLVSKHELGQRVYGTTVAGDPIRVTDQEAADLRVLVEPHDEQMFQRRPFERLESWYQATHGRPLSRQFRGRYSRAGAEKNGTSAGLGRPPKWQPTEPERKKMLELLANGDLSNQGVADRLNREYGLALTRYDVRYQRNRV